MWRVIASPSISNGIVGVPYGRKGHFAAVKVGGKGDITKTNRLWTKDVGADVPSPIAHDGKAYLVTDRGHIYCFNLESGEEIWNQKLPRSTYIPSTHLPTYPTLREHSEGVIPETFDLSDI